MPIERERSVDIRELMPRGWAAPRSLEPREDGSPEPPSSVPSAVPAFVAPQAYQQFEPPTPKVVQPPVPLRDTGFSLVREEAYVYDEVVKLLPHELAAVASILASCYERHVSDRVHALKALFPLPPSDDRPLQPMLKVPSPPAAAEEAARGLSPMWGTVEEGLREVLEMYSDEAGGGTTTPTPRYPSPYVDAGDCGPLDITLFNERPEPPFPEEGRRKPHRGPDRQPRRLRARKHAAPGPVPEPGEGSD